MLRIIKRDIKIPRTVRGKRKSEHGQSLVEMAGSLLFLLLLVSVVIDVGWAFYTLTTLRDTVQEAASYGAICPFADSTNKTLNENMVIKRFNYSANAPIDMNQISDVQVTFTDPAGNVLISPLVEGDQVMGGNVIVRVTMQHEILVPFLSAIIGSNTYPLTVDVTNTVLRSKYFQQCDD